MVWWDFIHTSHLKIALIFLKSELEKNQKAEYK